MLELSKTVIDRPDVMAFDPSIMRVFQRVTVEVVLLVCEHPYSVLWDVALVLALLLVHVIEVGEGILVCHHVFLLEVLCSGEIFIP